MGNIASNDNVKLHDKIGEGSYGEVYRGVWRGKQVAAKRIRSFFFENDLFCLQNQGKVFNDLKKEWELLSKLKHPNIVEYYTVILPQDGPPIIITELCDSDLHKFIRLKSNCKVLYSDAVSIMLDVAQGLEYLHGLEEPIIHRDLSSKNILLTASKRAKIADLGLAKAFPNGAMYATAGVGCQIYAAPETYPAKLAKGFYAQKAYYTEKIDIFSFGAILLEVIVGRLPEYLPDPMLDDGEVVPEHIRRSKDLWDMGTEHPLRPLVISCLDNLPEDRPDAGQLVECLAKLKPSQEENINLSSPDVSQPLYHSLPSTSTSYVTRMPTRGYDYAFKVVVLGSPGVGKTSIIQRFLHPNVPMLSSQTTLKPGDFFERLQIRGKTVHLQIVDSPGEVKSFFHNAASTMPLIYRGVSGSALVFDVGCRKSFNQLPVWLKLVRDRCGYESPIVVVGNQTDKTADVWEVKSEEAESWATKNDLFYIETSAKGLINIDEIFTILIEKMIQEKKRYELQASSSGYGINSDSSSSWILGIPSRSLLKNSSPATFGIPEITEKITTKPLPIAGSIRLEDTPHQRPAKRGCKQRCSSN